MSPFATIVVWVILAVLLAVEYFVGGVAAMAIGGVMAVLVALTYMRLVRTKGVAAAFALAGVFWLLVLLGLGSMDPATRHDIGVSTITEH